MAGTRRTGYEESNGCGLVMPESPGPVRSVWNAVLLLITACLVLWLCVQLLQSIWIWLVVGLAVGLIIFAISIMVRRRRGRW